VRRATTTADLLVANHEYRHRSKGNGREQGRFSRPILPFGRLMGYAEISISAVVNKPMRSDALIDGSCPDSQLLVNNEMETDE
jgi:hypothetical protein